MFSRSTVSPTKKKATSTTTTSKQTNKHIMFWESGNGNNIKILISHKTEPNKMKQKEAAQSRESEPDGQRKREEIGSNIDRGVDLRR